MFPWAGGATISIASVSSGCGVGASAPNPKSGSVHDSVIVANALRFTLAFFASQVGEKFVAQSALPSKWPSTSSAISFWGSLPSGARV